MARRLFHWDGYPTHLGKTIWQILHRDFLGSKGPPGISNSGDNSNAVRSFCDIYIDGHPSGWSSFAEICYCHDPRFVMRDGVESFEITSKDVGSDIEWVYVLNPSTVTMTIYGHQKRVADVDLLAKEPDWEAIQSKG